MQCSSHEVVASGPQSCRAAAVAAAQQCIARVSVSAASDVHASSDHAGYTTAEDSCSSSTSSSRMLSEVAVTCGICLESLPASSMVYAVLGPHTASSSAAAGATPPCAHSFCVDCMRQYVHKQHQRHPVMCPQPGCNEAVPAELVMQLLADDEGALQAYRRASVEGAVPRPQRLYCPYKDCQVMLEHSAAEADDWSNCNNRQARCMGYSCPYCKRPLCPNCGITGHHKGYTCAEFEALPAELHSVDDAALMRLARSMHWKRCPAAGCGFMVEKTAACNHMTCRCGREFCYRCGAAYRSRWRQGCRCG